MRKRLCTQRYGLWTHEESKSKNDSTTGKAGRNTTLKRILYVYGHHQEGYESEWNGDERCTVLADMFKKIDSTGYPLRMTCHCVSNVSVKYCVITLLADPRVLTTWANNQCYQ